MDKTSDVVYPVTLEQSRRLKAVHFALGSQYGISPYLASIKWPSQSDSVALSMAFYDVISRHEVLRSKITYPSFSSTPFQEVLAISDSPSLGLQADTPAPLKNVFDSLEQRWREGGCEHALLVANGLTEAGESCLAILLSPVFGDLPTLRIFAKDFAHQYHQRILGQAETQESPLQFVEVVDYLNERELEQPLVTPGSANFTSTGLQLCGFQEKRERQSNFCSAVVDIDAAIMEQMSRLCSRLVVSKESVLLAAAQRVWMQLHSTEGAAFTILTEGRSETELSGACGPYAIRQRLGGVWNAEEQALDDVLGRTAHFMETPFETCAEQPQSPNTMNLVFECGLGNTSADHPDFQLTLHAAPATRAETVISFATDAMASAHGALILSGHPATTSEAALTGLGQMICAQLHEWLSPAAECFSLPMHQQESLGGAYGPDLRTLLSSALRRGGNSLAIKLGRQALTYDQLHSFVNAAGWRLLELGADKNHAVVLIDTASIELIGTLCSCILLGIPFAVIDPEAPAQRRQAILNDLAASLILVTEGPLLAELQTSGAKAIGIGEFVTKAPLPIAPVDASHPAYVLYTSGSTGTPKGVEVSQAALGNFFSWMTQAFPLAPADRILVSTAPTFDVFLRETFWPLLQGATVVLPEQQSNWLDPRALASLCAKEQISHVRLVPSLISEFVHLGVVLPSCIKRFMSGGEALSTGLLQAFLEFNPLPFCVFYGPTETTINVAFWQGEGHFTSSYAPLGAPAAGARLFIVDDAFQPVPWGAAGQLCVAGRPLANGYKDNAALTQESFRWLDLGQPGKTRVYLTGDRARRLPDGCYEFLGRMDDQVKVRGFRIELGEVAHALRRQNGVVDALVLADPHATETRLIAYVMPAPITGGGTALREALRHELPEYMIPAAIVGLDQWPLTPNGKIDRRALRQPQAATGGRGALPAEGLQTQLAQAWAEVIEVEHLSVEDNFFDLGGHSLLAMRLIARLRENALHINLRQFFDRPTIARQAEFFTQQPQGQSLQAVEVPRLPREELLPLSMTQNRLWVLDQLAPGNPVYNIPLALRLSGPLQQPALQAALEEIVQRHEILRANFINDEGEPQISLRSSAILPFEHIDLSTAGQANALDQLLTQRARQPFDLSEDSLIRATLVKLGAEQVLLLVVHHIVFDGWSQSVLLKELAQLYSDLCNARAPSLPPLPYQYIDYAQWKRAQLAEQGVYERQQRFWREKLGSAPKVFGLPTDFPRPAVQSFAGAEYVFDLPQPLVQQLEKIAQEQKVTLFSLTLSAFAATLARLSGRQDVVVAVPHAGRYPDSGDLIGFFVNTVLISLAVDPASTIADQVNTAHQTAQEAFDNGDLPFDLVVRTLGLAGANHSAVTDVMFTFSYMDAAAVISEELHFEAYDVTLNVAKYGLMGSFIGHPDGAQFRFEYDVQLFAPNTIERFASSFSQQLADWISSHEQSCAVSPAQPIEGILK